MSWYSPRFIGELELNMIKPEYMGELSVAFNNMSLSKLLPVNYFDNHYMLAPIQHTNLFTHIIDKSFIGTVVKLGTLINGKYFGAHINDVMPLDIYRNWAIYGTVYIYNADGTRYSEKGVVEIQHRAGSGNAPENWGPLYMSLLIDDDAKKANFTILQTVVVYDTGTYFTNTTTRDVVGPYYLTQSELYEIVKGSVKEYDPDPWSNGGYGDIGGGDGALDLTSDIIALPDLPTSFVDTGFIQIFAPSLTQIKELADYMWKGSFFDNVIKLFSDPMSIIIGLSMYPFIISTSGQRIVHAGNVVTTVNMSVPDSQYVTIDCGTIDVKHFYDAYIDYEPYTNCQIYLPYVGIQSLSMDDIMGKAIQVVYRVDLMTGVCGAYILCDGVILYTFSGDCSSQIPISGQSFQSIVQSAINIATTTATAKGSGKTSKGEPIPSQKPTALASSLAGNVMSMKPDVSRSGNVSSNVGMLGPQKPYLIFSVPRTCLPKGQNKYLGYPAFMTVKLSNLEGYTEVENLWLNNMTCTEVEKKEIEELLKGGAIL